jgi:hypothetical protein
VRSILPENELAISAQDKLSAGFVQSRVVVCVERNDRCEAVGIGEILCDHDISWRVTIRIRDDTAVDIAQSVAGLG